MSAPSTEPTERTYRVARMADGQWCVLDEFEGDLVVATVLAKDIAEMVARWFAGDFALEVAGAGPADAVMAGLLRSLAAQLGEMLDAARQVIDQLSDLSWIVEQPEDQPAVRRCRGCGCTDTDCSQCIERTGQPCSWVEPDLCSACASSAVTIGGR